MSLRIESRLIAALALGAATGLAQAAWQVVETTARVQTEIDLATISRKDGQVTGWVQHTYTKKATTQTGAYFVYRTMKEQVRLNCAQQTMAVLTRGYFDDDGSEIASIKGAGEARTVMPDTAEQRVLGRMCNPTAEHRAARPKAPPKPAPSPSSAEPRFMDGPAPIGPREGIVRAKAEPASPPAPAALAKPASEAAGKAADTPGAAAGKPVSGADKPAPKATEAAAHTPPPKAGATLQESRDMIVARIMKVRAGAPPPPEPSPRARPVVVAANSHAASARGGAAKAPPQGGAHAHEHHHWAYEGEFAPYKWGDVKAEYAACKTGTRQSPIDIRNPVIGEVEPIQFRYEDVPLKVTNNGHTIQVDYAPGSFILFGGNRYELVGFHFHSPSEERINGRAFDMVAHLVHRSAQGRLAVVAVLLTAGAEQPMLQAIWNAMPGTRGNARERLDVAINAQQLLPADRTYYSYMGSLTTPPCTEGVQWLVMKTPVEISREQIAHFTALYPMNARPLQAHNDRLIKVGR